MASYQVINLQTGDFAALSLDEVAEVTSLDPREIEWAIEEYGVCEVGSLQITKLPEPPECDGGEAGEAENKAHQRDCACCMSLDHLDESGRVVGRTIYCFS
jgi:hypothetical protein